MKFLHQSMFVSLSLLLACAGKSQQSNDPDAGKYDGYYSEASDDPATSDGEPNATDSNQPQPQGTETTSTKALPSGALAKAIAAKKPPVAGKKKKNAKKKRNKKKGTAFQVAFDGALPTAAPKGALVEVFGSGLDQKGLMVTVGGTKAEIVEQAEDRVLIKVPGGVKGGKGNIALGKTPAAGKEFKAVATSAFVFDVLGAEGLGGRTQSEQGLIGNVYAIDGEVTELPTFAGEPVGTVAVDNLNVTAANYKAKIAGKNEWFGVHFRGSLNVVEAGSYEFCLNADDGAQLYLDENLIVDNDGIHTATEVCATFDIEPGEFQLDLLYFQGAKGPMALQLMWAKDGGAKEAIPASALFPPADAADLARE